MKILSENRKAFYEYNILEKFEGGLVLLGQEVKSIKTGHINLSGSYIIIKQEEPFLVGTKVPPYQPKNMKSDYNEERDRKVLLTKKEITHLLGKSKQKGFSLIPLQIFEKNGKVKIAFGLAQGKKKHDKKEKIKRRDIERETRRDLAREWQLWQMFIQK